MKIFLGLFIIIVTLVFLTRANPTAIDPDGKIVGGTQTSINNAPWMVALQFGIQPDTMVCGATLIAPQWILTAAHCVHGVSSNPSVISARFGSNQYNNGGILRTASLVIIHPDFDLETNFNDLALVKLNSPVIYGPTIQPINLATATSFFQNLDNIQAHIYGYGTLFSGGDLAPSLRSTTVNIKSQTSCINAYGSDYNSTINLCAAASGKDFCEGDSGGPMTVVAPNGSRYQVGIISWGYGCADPFYPGVYTKVSHFFDWIWATVNSN